MKHFEELLLSLGASRSTELLAGRHWTLWQAEFRTPVSIVKGNYLYLKSSCPLQEASSRNLSNIAAHCGSEGYQVVVPPRSDLSRDIANTASRFRATSGKTTQVLLEDHLLKGVDYRPLEHEEHFISPTLRVQGSESGRDGLQFLTKWLVGQESAPSGAPIGLICADGGIGKTTLARELCESVRREPSASTSITDRGRAVEEHRKHGVHTRYALGHRDRSTLGAWQPPEVQSRRTASADAGGPAGRHL